jgi:hypothetical protein
VKRVAVVVGVAIAAVAHAQPYARDARVAYLGRALDAIRGLGADGRAALEGSLYRGARQTCRGASGVPSIKCLLDLGVTTCRSAPAADACLVAADVILANGRAETEFVDEATRARLVASGGDYRASMRVELDKRYAALATDLVLAEPGADRDLAARIDRFCARREKPPAWQRCAAALVWFVAGAP